MMDHLKIIRSEAEYEWALKEVEQYFRNSPEPGTVAGDRFDLLVMLIEQYEKSNFPVERPDPVEAIKCRMDDLALNQKGLSAITGLAESKISEILNRRRGLSLDMIRKLSVALKLPTDVLVQEYSLPEVA